MLEMGVVVGREGIFHPVGEVVETGSIEGVSEEEARVVDSREGSCNSKEVARIKNEHPDDINCIVNDRVKGRLKVTRAFGAGSLKQPKLNDALLEMFRNEFIGTTPYISWFPSLRHHKLSERSVFGAFIRWLVSVLDQ